VAKTRESWKFGYVGVLPKSLSASFFDYMAKGDGMSMGIKVLEHKEKGLNHLSS